jgi:hypothetical protein
MKQDECSRLTGQVQRVGELGPAQLDRMYTLLTCYFTNITPAGFKSDLAEKEWVIVLIDTHTGQMRGFSTLMRLHTTVDGQPVTAFFSGDTIIQREYWGDTALPRLWAQHVFSVAETIRPEKVYWFLICSGYKTYRFLSVFFRVFYPNYQQCPPPAIKKLLDTLGRLKFPTEYDPVTGVVRLAHRTPLRPGVAAITARHLKDPHIAFFAAANPGHIYGDELACLTEITPTNLTPAGRRMLERR